MLVVVEVVAVRAEVVERREVSTSIKASKLRVALYSLVYSIVNIQLILSKCALCI